MKKSLQGTFLIILFIAVIAFVTGCNKNSDNTPIPVVLTSTVVSQLTSTSVTAGSRAASTVTVSADGICWSATNTTPTLTDSHTTDTIAVNWASKLTGLTPNTTYYIRSYATNSAGTGYGAVVSFKTNASAAVPTGTVTTIAGSTSSSYGFADGAGSSALFDGPVCIAYNPLNNLLYVSDSFNNAIRTVTTAGVTNTLTNPAAGYKDGPLSTALFYGVQGISFDAQGTAYVADMANNVIRKITLAGAVTTLAGSTAQGYVNGQGNAAEFYNPQATVLDPTGNVYVADRSNNLIRKISPAGYTNVYCGYLAAPGISQTLTAGYYDSDYSTALFNYPMAITIDAAGNLYIADFRNKAIRKIGTDGTASTYAGGQNFPNILGNPSAVVADAQGNLFIADNTGRVLEITAAKVLYVLAGATNATGFTDGVGKAARFNGPQSLTLDGQGNLYVTDFANNAIRKITIAVQ